MPRYGTVSRNPIPRRNSESALSCLAGTRDPPSGRVTSEPPTRTQPARPEYRPRPPCRQPDSVTRSASSVLVA
eukprot:753900-Hanusia_phi.AAC.1